MNSSELAGLSKRIRTHALRMTHSGGGSHIGSILSIADILAVLYGRILRIDPTRPEWPERDRFILSKGHAAAGLYAALAETGFFPKDWLDSHYRDGSRLCGHVSHVGLPGVDLSSGSLGHGLSIAAGMALVSKRDRLPWRVFALLSDGECDEGSTWEPALFAPHHKLENLVAIVDYNKIQSLAPVSETLALEPFSQKWSSFGWAVKELNGHDIPLLTKTLESIPFEPNKPSCVIANTIKGKGISFMENAVLWHYRPPDKAELQRALEELEKTA